MRIISKFFLLFCVCFALFNSGCKDKQYNELDKTLQSCSKEEVFIDSCTKDWTTHWKLDGTKARIYNSAEGMDFYAGEEHGNDTCHAVLWTKKAFKGDLLIQYQYTKLDTQNRNVNILYIQASGEKPFRKNIHLWSEDRMVPSMYKYFKQMNTLHISYAAFGVQGSDSDYIRARRYMPLTQTLKQTNFGTSYENTGLFETGKTYQISVLKKGYDVYMQVERNKEKKLFHWNYIDFPIINEGYIGLRHMYTRSSRYKNFKVFHITE